MMAFIAIGCSGRKCFGRFLLISLVLSGSSLLVLSQTVNRNAGQKVVATIPASPVNTASTRTDVDETFELNIAERRYSQESFEASTAVETTGTENLNLQIGVTLTSGRIEVLMRNVHGTVRFRGTLGRILRMISNRQARSAETPAAVPPAQSVVPSPD